jgi:excisionase family DNA binding protein
MTIPMKPCNSRDQALVLKYSPQFAVIPETSGTRIRRQPDISASVTLHPEDRLLTYAQAAELSGVDHTFIRKAVRGRELRAVILGPKTHRIRLGELQRWRKAKQMIGFTTSI